MLGLVLLERIEVVVDQREADRLRASDPEQALLPLRTLPPPKATWKPNVITQSADDLKFLASSVASSARGTLGRLGWMTSSTCAANQN